MEIEGEGDLDCAGNLWMELQYSKDPVKPICVCVCVFLYILYINHKQVSLLDSDLFPENY